MSTTTKPYQLPKEFAEKYVTALRSGDYIQYKGELTTGSVENCFCAIGLGYIMLGIGKRKLLNSVTFDKTDDEKAKLLRQENPKTLQKLSQTLITLNDCEEKTFPEIADWIEENVEFIEEVTIPPHPT